MLAYARERGTESGFVHRLHEVVERVRLERVHHAESVDLGHLHVEKNEVRGELVERAQRLASIAALPGNGDVRMRLEELANAAPRERLVVGDDRANLTHAASPPRPPDEPLGCDTEGAP